MVIDHIIPPPTQQMFKGTLVHRALQKFYGVEDYGVSTDKSDLEMILDDVVLDSTDEIVKIGFDEHGKNDLVEGAKFLLRQYLEMESPESVNPVGVELQLETEIDGVLLRGIIDRLDIDSDGNFIVVDYKTGKSPKENLESERLQGVKFYGLLCEEVLGIRPREVRLLYLGDKVTISTELSGSIIKSFKLRTKAVWHAISRACEMEDFRPHPSPKCSWCYFSNFCPTTGGDPEQVNLTDLVINHAR